MTDWGITASLTATWAAIGTTIAMISTFETAVLNARRSRFPAPASGRDERAIARAQSVLDGAGEFQAGAHLAKSLCEAFLYPLGAVIGAALTGNSLLQPIEPTRAWPGLVLGCIISFLLVTLIAEAFCKSLSARRPETILLRNAGLIQALTRVLLPLLWMARRFGRFLAFSAGADPYSTARAARSEEEIKLLVEGSAEEGVLEQEEKEMIQSIIEFTDTVARQIMIPRVKIIGVADTASLDEVVRIAIDTGFSRMPVHDGSLDHVVGILHIKDLLPHLVTEGERRVPLRQLARKPYFVPEGKKLDELLSELRSHNTQLAIVVDEFGGTSGLVTLEDVLEEIVGEIADEHDDTSDQPDTWVREVEDGYVLDARVPLVEANEELSLDLDAGDYDTVGGFVFSRLGRLPAVGEKIETEATIVTTLEMDGPSIRKLHVARKPIPGAEPPVNGEAPANGRA